MCDYSSLDSLRAELMTVACRFVNPDDAEDVVSDVILAVLTASGSVDPVALVKNGCRDLIRDRLRQGGPLNEEIDYFPYGDADLLPLAREIFDSVSLPPRQKLAFALHLEGLNQSEIAGRMGISQQAVSKLLKAARTRLSAGTS